MHEINSPTFEERSSQIIQEIEPIPHLIKKFTFTAREWENVRIGKHRTKMPLIDAAFDEVLEELFKLDVEFSEDQEKEMRLTVTELILNSVSASYHAENNFITCEYTFGKKGLALRVSDVGPGFDYRAEIQRSIENINGLTRSKMMHGLTDHDYPGGAGMYCLVNFSTHFQHNETGNEVILNFHFRR